MNSSLHDLEGTRVMRPSHAEVAVQYSSSSSQPAQAVERIVMSKYMLYYKHSYKERFKWPFPAVA